MEAILAVLIIAGVLLLYASQKDNTAKEDKLFEGLESFLDEIAKDGRMRELILDNNEKAIDEIIDKLKKRVAVGYVEYKVFICEPNASCGEDAAIPENVELYSDHRYISSTLTNDKPKIVKIVVLRKAAG